MCWLFSRSYFGVKVVGRENIPGKGAFIFVSNHSSYLDPILLGTACHRSLNYMARDTLFEEKALGWALSKVHAFPVRRNENDLKAVKDSIRIVKSGRPLVIFPEGTRTKDGNLQRGKRGVGFIVAKAKAMVVPAYIDGSFEAMPRGFDSKKRHPIKVFIGKPIDFNHQLESDPRKFKDLYQDISDRIMRDIAQLKAIHG